MGSFKLLVIGIMFLCFPGGSSGSVEQLRNRLLANGTVKLRPGEQTNITTKLILTSLNKLDSVDQELSTTFQLLLKWTHPGLVWTPTVDEPSQLVFYVKEVWTPPVVVSNAVDDALFLLQDDIVPLRVTNGGKVTWLPRLSPRTTCEINIANFPADEQTCCINITSWGHITDEIDLLLPSPEDGSGVVLDLKNDKAWNLYKATAMPNSRVYTADMAFSNIEFKFYFKREVKFYEYILIAPFCCIVFLMTLVFLVPSEHQTEKIIYSVTLFMAFTMFLNLLPSLLPPVFNKEGANVFGDYILGVTIFGTVTTFVLFLELVVLHLYRLCRGNDEANRREYLNMDADSPVNANSRIHRKPPQVPYAVNLVFFFVFVVFFIIFAVIMLITLNN